MSNNYQHNPFTQQNTGWQQQQPIFGQSTNFVAGSNDFPTLDTQQTKQAPANTASDNPFASFGTASFTPSSAEFVPQGVVAGTEAFPDLDALSSMTGKKKKALVPTKQQIEAEKLAAELEMSTKGKPFSFFLYNGALSQEQMVFVFQYYPQYSMNPAQIFDWLQTEAKRYEVLEQQKRDLEQQAYAQPSRSGQQRNNNNYEDYYEEETTNNEDSSFGILSAKQKKKGAANQQSKQDPNLKKEIKTKQVEALAKQESTVKTKTIVKDVNVKIDEETIINVDETRQPCTMVFIGHVDAGKSTISGQIMYLMGCVDERTIEKYKKDAKDKGRDSWWLAYCMDIGEEEKAKGKTVEVGRATFNTNSKQFTVFDAPGHKNYVPNMIMGAALADYAGLVISARKGEFEAGFEKDGQTRDHVQLAKSLGVQKLIVVVNKMDEPTVQWSETRWNEIKEKLGPFLLKSGYSKDDVFYVPISGLTGDNIVQSVDPSRCSWYKGPTLMNILDDLPVENRDASGFLRIPVLDKQKDQGVTAHGKIEQGTIRVGDKIMMSPSGYPAQIGAILDHKNESVRFARPGENVQIKLIHIDDDNMINKGDIICGRENLCPVTMLFEAEVELYELLEHKPIISKGYSCIMHCHTFADEIVVKDIMSVTEKNLASGLPETKDAPKFVKAFSTCRVRITTKNPLAMEKFETIPQLGRFTLRDEGRTIAAGKIIKYKPHKVECSVQVSSAPVAGDDSKKVADSKPTTDKNETLIFDGETGEVVKKEKALDSIAEE